jgi:hypothetical protein
MNYRGTIAYRAGIGNWIPEGFFASFIPAWDFLNHEYRYPPGAIIKVDSIPPSIDKLPRARFNFIRGLSCMLHDSANQIAEGFLGDWVLFLDTDHVFKSDAFYEMVTTFEDNHLDILVGFAQKRQPPYLPLIVKTNFDPLLDFEPIIPGPVERNTLIPIDAAGLACTMVRRTVFEQITRILGEKPFDFRKKFDLPPFTQKLFFENTYAGGQYVPSDLPPDRRFDEFYWEDISFFWRAALVGVKAFCAPWIKFHHIETRLVTDEMMQMPDERVPK